MGKVNRPDTLVSELAALKRRVAQLETQQRLSSARISSGQLNVGAIGADGQIEIDATDEQIRILRDGQVIAALSTTDGLFLSGYAGAEFANGITIQPTNANGSDFAPATVFSWTDLTTGENQTWISGPYDLNRGNNSAGILLRGSDATNGGTCSIYLDANTVTVAGELKADGMTAYSTELVTAPTFTGDGLFHNFTTAQWPQIDIAVPPSGMIEIGIVALLYNSTSDASTAAVSCNIIDLTNGSALVFNANLNQSAVETSYGAGPATGAAAPFTNAHQNDSHFFVAGLTPGNTVRINPTYRFSSLSGSPLRGGINYGRIAVRPAIQSI